MNTEIELHGIVEGMSNADYHAKHDYVSSSYLKVLMNSTPDRANHERATPKDSAAMAFGTAVHAAILTPTEFASGYRVAPEFDKRTKEGKAGYADFIASCDPATTFMSSDDYEKILELQKNLAKQQNIASLLEACHMREVSVFDAHSSPKLRCRLDSYDPNRGAVIDLKTMRLPASEDNFRRALSVFGYGIQAAFYRNCCRGAGIEIKEFGFICMETLAPYEVRGFVLDEEMMDMYETDVSVALANVLDKGTWPDKFTILGVKKYVRFEGAETSSTF